MREAAGQDIGNIRAAVWMRDESGSALIEVITAFAVLLFIFGMLSQALLLTGRIMVRNRELRAEYQDLAGYYYLHGAGDDLVSEEGKIETEWQADLRFFLESDGENEDAILEIPVIIREFKGKHEVLYDAVPEEALFDEVQ